MNTWQSMVLLTVGEPSLRPENVQRRLHRWTGLDFSDKEDSSANFIVAGDGAETGAETGAEIAIVKLDSEYLFLITLLKRSYWDSEYLGPYAAQAEMAGDSRLSEYLRACRGAMLFDAHIGPNLPQKLLYLGKLTAAAMENDTPVLVVPPSVKADLVTSEMRSALGGAAEPADLMPYALNFHLVPEDEFRGVAFTVGMPMYGLPNVIMRYCGDDAERVALAVQSVATYQVQRGQPMPVGDTMSNSNLGVLRCIAADQISPEAEPGAVVGLEWV